MLSIEKNGRTIQESFEIFDEKNPKVYEYFKKFALDFVKRKGLLNRKGNQTKTSANLIINRVRWEIYLETISEDGFKINNNFASRYARKFAKEYPEYETIFNFREQRSY